MNFASFADFLAMGHHAQFVWPAYGLCLLVLLVGVLAHRAERRRYLQQEARRLRRENRS